MQSVINALCQLSSHDVLTGLPNRRSFSQAMERELDRVARSGDVALLLMDDIDFFKHVNDTHGHLAGDEVLRQVAVRLLECVRPMDTVARYGGEEFVVLLCAPQPGEAEQLAGRVGHFDPAVIPAVCYTEPEIAGVGRTEEQLREGGVPFRKGVSSFRSNGRALALGHVDGRVKVLAHADTDRVLGVHIIGPRAGDLIAEAAAAMAFGASAEDIDSVCHAHPTLSEVVREAAFGAGERASGGGSSRAG